MQNLIPCRSKLPVILKPILFVTLLAISGTSCLKIKELFGLNSYVAEPKVTHWLSWNFYFRSSVPESAKDSILNGYRKLLKSFAKSQDPTVDSVVISLHYCPCDSSLTNLDATIISGSGKSISPPPTVPKPGPSGDYMLSTNIMEFQVADSSSALVYDKYNNLVVSIPVVDSAVANHDKIDGRVLAIIDTGLDSAAFSSDITQLMWKDPTQPTLYDVMPGEDPFSSASVYDSNKVKHGTAAAALALSQITNPTVPRIMPIKAFAVNEKGSIYTVSCAMSYAIQKHARFINASWGYFGDMDSVLYHYMKSANDSGIAIFAAAGNTQGHHFLPVCKPTLNTVNFLQDVSNLGSSHLFYPACFSDQLDNLITVHQLQFTSNPDNLLPCFYQDYSGQYVNLGILTDNPSCCLFKVLNSSLEGSSFATPVATGMLMSLTGDGHPFSMRKFVDLNSKHYQPPLFTRGGNYLSYVPHFKIR